MSKDTGEWLKWRAGLEPRELELKKAKKVGKIKLAAAFGVGATLGTGFTAFIAWKLFKSFFGGWLKYGMFR